MATQEIILMLFLHLPHMGGSCYGQNGQNAVPASSTFAFLLKAARHSAGLVGMTEFGLVCCRSWVVQGSVQ